MIKIFPISDIHAGIWHPQQSYWGTHFSFLNDIDVMVIAGDGNETVGNMVLLTQILLEFPNLHVVYVPGNHDFYGMNIDRALEEYCWADYSIDRLHLLTGKQYSYWTYKDVTFIGGTLWTNFNNQNAYTMNEVQRELHDYDEIMSGKDGKRITANRIVQEHYAQVKYIFKQLERRPEQKKIVVTHHKPYLSDCITDVCTYGYEVDLTNKFNECEHLPEYWISGHTHRSEWKVKEFTHGTVTFVSNQFGYPSEDVSKTGFNRNCILEV